jgi:flagellar basal-body rod protein FlgB
MGNGKFYLWTQYWDLFSMQLTMARGLLLTDCNLSNRGKGTPMADNVVQKFLIDQYTPTAVLKKTLDAQATRQRAHAQNIANAETPGYRRVAVDFESELQSVLGENNVGAMKRTDSRHMNTGGSGTLEDLAPKIRVEQPDSESSGVNSVDMDQEMSEMAETQIRYLTALELLKRRYTSLKSAIKGQ